jgi:hypothetical protein
MLRLASYFLKESSKPFFNRVTAPTGFRPLLGLRGFATSKQEQDMTETLRKTLQATAAEVVDTSSGC